MERYRVSEIETDRQRGQRSRHKGGGSDGGREEGVAIRCLLRRLLLREQIVVVSTSRGQEKKTVL